MSAEEDHLRKQQTAVKSSLGQASGLHRCDTKREKKIDMNSEERANPCTRIGYRGFE